MSWDGDILMILKYHCRPWYTYQARIRWIGFINPLVYIPMG